MLDPRSLRSSRLRNKSVQYLVCGFIGFLSIALYQTIISPFINPEPWLKIREKTSSKIPADKRVD